MRTGQDPVVDPNSRPVCPIDHITLHDVVGQQHDMTLSTWTYVPQIDGGFKYTPIVMARIRFSSEMARAIVLGLSQQLAMLEMHGKAEH